MSAIDESKIQNLLKELQALQVPEHSILRAKNIVMNTVRKEPESRPLLRKQSFINSLLPHRYMIAFSLILALLLGGGGTVAAAQNDLPGDTLYPIKIASEVIAEKLALSNQAKVKVEAKLAERRANEVIVLNARTGADASEIKERILKATERLEVRIEKTKARVEALKARDTKGTLNAAAVLQAKVERMEAALGGATSAQVNVAPKEVRGEIREKLKEARKDAIEKKQEDKSSRSEQKSPEDITIELDGEGAVEIELEVPQLQEKRRPFNLLERKEE